jgi:hypothetical protein
MEDLLSAGLLDLNKDLEGGKWRERQKRKSFLPLLRFFFI